MEGEREQRGNGPTSTPLPAFYKTSGAAGVRVVVPGNRDGNEAGRWRRTQFGIRTPPVGLPHNEGLLLAIAQHQKHSSSQW